MLPFRRKCPAYHYIIVGAGSAGTTLAARLSEDPTVSVLLLEAGADYRSNAPPPEIQSLNAADGFQKEAHYWPTVVARPTTVQQPRLYPRSWGVGGNSAINAQGAIRGQLEDFDRWAQQGCHGWAGHQVLRSFKRLEHDFNFGDRPYHGLGGPLPIVRAALEEWAPVDLALRDAALDLGYGWSEDINAPGSAGVAPLPRNSRQGRRVSTNDAYLESARTRPNLHIVGNALVDRVLFDHQRAVGVCVWTREGWQLIGGHEVILCAGAIHSPAILQRSGIGPADHLRSLGIEPLWNAPGVGHNLIEQPLIVLPLLLQPAASGGTPQRPLCDCCVRYSSGCTDAADNDMLLFSWSLAGCNPSELGQGRLLVSATQVFSRGDLRITSANPEVNPWIEFRLLSDERDLVRMRDGVRRLFEIAHHRAVAGIAEQVLLDEQGCSLPERMSDREIDEWLLANCGWFLHAAGTCRMGTVDDPQTVVEPDGSVIGVDGLRIADASIMPEHSRGLSYLDTVMIAEHLADHIKRQGAK